jgi:hypothetical protein
MMSSRTSSMMACSRLRCRSRLTWQWVFILAMSRRPQKNTVVAWSTRDTVCGRTRRRAAIRCSLPVSSTR